MRSSRLWSISVGLAGIHDCGMALYHLVLPYHWGWRQGLDSVAASLVWALFALNFSWVSCFFSSGAWCSMLPCLGRWREHSRGVRFSPWGCSGRFTEATPG